MAFAFVKRNWTAVSPPSSPKDADALRFGILGAANIAPMAFITPALSHPGVVVAAVAARDPAKARAFAKKHNIAKTYSGATGYQQLLDDPNIDAIYNPLPNGLHFEWTAKALKAGKHVLLEKPSCDTAVEIRALFELAREKDRVLLEAFHYRFHPATHRVLAIVRSGELGPPDSLRVSATLATPGLMIAAGDIRYNFALGGGAMMDMGCYPLSVARLLLGAEPSAVTSATARPAADPKVDAAMRAELAFPSGATAEIVCDFALPARLGVVPRLPVFGLSVRGAKGALTMNNFILPSTFHSITVTPTAGTQRVESAFTPPLSSGARGEAWWSTYRYQLEAFVDKVRGREPAAWMTPEDSIAQMEAIEKVYEKSGLPQRPSSAYTV